MKLTQQDTARLLGIDARTLRNWRKEKPYLYEIIMKGFAFEEAVKKAQQNADELKALNESFKIKKERLICRIYNKLLYPCNHKKRFVSIF